MKLNCFATQNANLDGHSDMGIGSPLTSHPNQHQAFASRDFLDSFQKLQRAFSDHRRNHPPLAELAQAMRDFDKSEGLARLMHINKVHEATGQSLGSAPEKTNSSLMDAIQQFYGKTANAVMGQKSIGRDPWEKFYFFQALEDCRAHVAKNILGPVHLECMQIGVFDVELHTDAGLSAAKNAATQAAIKQAFEDVGKWPEARFLSRKIIALASDSPAPLFRTQAFAGNTPCICLGKNFFAPPNPRIAHELEGPAGALVRGGIGVSGPRGVADILVDEQNLVGDAANHMKKVAVILHELAHLIHAGTDPLKFLEMKEGSSPDCNPIPDAEMVSHYATSNALEFVAEALVSKRHGQTLPPKIQNALDRFIRQ